MPAQSGPFSTIPSNWPHIPQVAATPTLDIMLIVVYAKTILMTVTISLLERAIAKDKRAVRELIGALTPIVQTRVARVLLRRAAGRHCDIQQETLDLTQTAFVALLENDGRLLRAWDPARGMSLENYVGLIAEQQAAARLRKRSSSIQREHLVSADDLDSTVDSSRTPERLVASSEAIQLVRERVYAQVSDYGRRIFHMLFIEGRSIEEVCTAAGMTESAVYAWRSRLGRLAQTIAEDVLADPPPATNDQRGGL